MVVDARLNSQMICREKNELSDDVGEMQPKDEIYRPSERKKLDEVSVAYACCVCNRG